MPSRTSLVKPAAAPSEEGLSVTFFLLCCTTCGILVSRPGIEPRLWAVKAQSPNHWTIGEFPFFKKNLLRDAAEAAGDPGQTEAVTSHVGLPGAGFHSQTRAGNFRSRLFSEGSILVSFMPVPVSQRPSPPCPLCSASFCDARLMLRKPHPYLPGSSPG